MASINNKRIAKNTLLLYFRMLFMMTVSLYTSRVVLNTLGVNDYGLYNVVGGIVAMFAFISGSMTSATQRYITFAIGKGNKDEINKVFCIALQIHILIAVVLIIVSEIFGLYFLYNKMLIPQERMNAAFWVLQCSILSTAIIIVSVPYNADIIAHERMSAFAYISIVEVILKLLIVYILTIFSIDKLILYAFLLLAIQVFIRYCYNRYCNRHFEETKYHHLSDKKLFKEMTSFAGWGLFENTAGALYTQGLNILLNMFFGAGVNAARAIAVQVLSTVRQFIGNFQMAINPQITKTYSQNNFNEMHKLVYRSARFSFFILFLLTLPILFETQFILKVWLKTIPENTVVFLRLMICVSLTYTMSNPLVIANQATGKVKKYQLICGSLLLMILPIAYLCLRLDCPAYSVFIVHLVMEIITQIARMKIMCPLIHLRMKDYFKNIYVKILFVVVLSIIAPCIIYFNMDDNVLRFFVVSFISMLSVSLTSYIFGLSNAERTFVKAKAVTVICQVKKLFKS